MTNKLVLLDPAKRRFRIWLKDQAHLQTRKDLVKSSREFDGYASILEETGRVDDKALELLLEEIQKLGALYDQLTRSR